MCFRHTIVADKTIKLLPFAMSKSDKLESNGSSIKEPYKSPKLIDYGKMSELTQTLPGPGTGDDGAGTPSSYTASGFPL